MTTKSAAAIIDNWPEDSREAAQIVLDTYGEPDEAVDSLLIWHKPGPWKRVEAARTFHDHDFPVPHIDSVLSVIDYHVPADKFSALAEFDGSVIAERTAGEVSARCHDEQANFLALNLVHDIVTGDMTVDEARRYYAKEFLDARRGRPTPYMEKLRFAPSGRPAREVATSSRDTPAWASSCRPCCVPLGGASAVTCADRLWPAGLASWDGTDDPGGEPARIRLSRAGARW